MIKNEELRILYENMKKENKEFPEIKSSLLGIINYVENVENLNDEGIVDKIDSKLNDLLKLLNKIGKEGYWWDAKKKVVEKQKNN